MRSEARRLGPVERLLHIKAMPAAQGLSDESLMALATHALEHEFRAGERLHSGEHAPAFCYILTSGRVRVTLNGVTLYEVGSLGVVGALEVCASVDGTLEATALEGGLALKISRETLLSIYEDHFSVMHAALRGMAELLLAAPWEQITGEAITPIAEGSSMHGNVLGRLADLVTLFPKARADSLLRLALAMEKVDVPDGELLWEVGDPADHMLFVLRGSVGCELRDSSFRAPPGTRVGMFESLAERPRWHRAVAVGELSALRLPAERLLTRMEDDFELASAVLAGLANTLLTVLRKKGG
jgi:CRP-like cAMP-binding protein